MENYMKLAIFINREINEVIKAKQFDAASRFLDVTLLNDNGLCCDLTGCRVQFNAKKADGSYIMNNAVITEPKNGRCLIELTDQTLALGGSNIEADIAIITNDGKSILTTRTFLIQVQTTQRNDRAVESSDEYGAVVTLFQDVWDMRETIRSVNERFGLLTDDMQSGDTQAGTSALGALNRIWNYLKTQSTAGIVEKVNEISNTIGTGSTSVLGYLKTMETRGVIKYVQRGTVSIPTEGTLKVPINKAINPDRTIVNLYGTAGIGGGSSYYSYDAYVVSLTSTELTIASYVGVLRTSSYQIVEFY